MKGPSTWKLIVMLLGEGVVNVVKTNNVNSGDQLADLFTKTLRELE